MRTAQGTLPGCHKPLCRLHSTSAPGPASITIVSPNPGSIAGKQVLESVWGRRGGMTGSFRCVGATPFRQHGSSFARAAHWSRCALFPTCVPQHLGLGHSGAPGDVGLGGRPPFCGISGRARSPPWSRLHWPDGLVRSAPSLTSRVAAHHAGVR